MHRYQGITMNKRLVEASSLCAAQQTPAIGGTDSKAHDPDVLEDVVVTANKREESSNKVGLSVSPLTREDMALRGIVSLEDLATAIPGLVYSPSVDGTPILTLRGVGFNESSIGVYPAVSIYVDQAPLPFAVLGRHAAFDLERVEVLKGPQGTLFGENATGGAINYIGWRKRTGGA